MSDRTKAHVPPAALLFENAFELAAIGMALVAPDGRCLRANRAVCQLTGYTEEELIRLRLQDFSHPEDLAFEQEKMDKLLRSEAFSYQMEKRLLHKDGTEVWLLVSVARVSDDTAPPRFLISQMQDISERKESEAKLREAAAEIEKLRCGLLKVCAWTKRIKVEGRWVSIEEFLRDSLGLQLTHEMSEEAEKLFGKPKRR